MASRIAQLSGKPLLDPREALKWAERNGTPTDFWGRANSYQCPRGPEPGTAWLLMLRSDLDDLDKNEYHALTWTDGHHDEEISIGDLVIVRGVGINLALPGDPNAAYLVELQDKRRILKRSHIAKQYNVPIPVPPNCGEDTYPEVLYYPDSLDSGERWTWQSMLQDIWDNLPEIAGDAPSMPWAPDTYPENFRFVGMSAWDALHIALNALSCTTALNPIAGEFLFIRRSSEQSGLAQSLSDLESRRMYDYDPVSDTTLADVPASVVVYYRRRERYRGIEKDTPREDNWESHWWFATEVDTGIDGAVGYLPVWADVDAMYDEYDNLINGTVMDARAIEITDELVGAIQRENRKGIMWTGLTSDVLPGSEIRETVWRDYGDAQGLVTEIRGGSDPEIVSRKEPPKVEYPVYPRESHIVYIAAGEVENGCGFYHAKVCRMVGGGVELLEDCWVKFLNDFSDPCGNAVDRSGYHIGRLTGTATCLSCQWPLYAVRDYPDSNYLKMADVDECDEEGYLCAGSPIQTLLIGKGLYLSGGECSEYYCTAVLQTDGLEVIGTDCEGDETQKLGVRTLHVDAPLKFEAGDESECLGTARIGLPIGLLQSDCLEVEYTENCTYKLDLPENFVTGGNGVSVTPRANGCGYMVSVNGGNADPLVTIQYVCGIECVYNESTEKYELVVSYGTLDLPASLVQNATSECEEAPTPPGDGEYITIESLNCESWPDKYVAVTLNSLPDNTDHYILRTINERTGEFVEFGPDTDNHETPGATYWFVIPTGSTAGDTIQVEIEFYDAGGAMLDNQVEYTQCAFD